MATPKACAEAAAATAAAGTGVCEWPLRFEGARVAGVARWVASGAGSRGSSRALVRAATAGRLLGLPLSMARLAPAAVLLVLEVLSQQVTEVGL